MKCIQVNDEVMSKTNQATKTELELCAVNHKAQKEI